MISYPVGTWLGRSTEAPTFHRLDRHQGEGGCLFGFVTDGRGNPVAGAEVLLTSPAGSPAMRRSDESGFYRFEALRTGAYAVTCRAQDDEHAMQRIVQVEVPESPHAELRERRQDLTLWPGAIELAVDESERAAVLQISTAEHGLIWRATPRDDGRIRVHNIPPGAYTLQLQPQQDAPAQDLPALDITVDCEGPIVLRSPRHGGRP